MKLWPFRDATLAGQNAIAIQTMTARVASRKGHSFILFFLFSLVFFPAALIVAYLVGDRRGPG